MAQMYRRARCMYRCMVLMYRWSQCAGGLDVQVPLTYRWSRCTSSLIVQMVPMYRWSRCTGGPNVQMVSMYKWFRCTDGTNIQMVSTYVRTSGLNVRTTLQVTTALFEWDSVAHTNRPPLISTAPRTCTNSVVTKHQMAS